MTKRNVQEGLLNMLNFESLEGHILSEETEVESTSSSHLATSSDGSFNDNVEAILTNLTNWYQDIIRKSQWRSELVSCRKFCAVSSVALIVVKREEMEFNHVNLRPCMDWTDRKCSNEAKVANKPGMLTRQSGNGCASTEKKDNTGVLVEETVDKECLAEEVGLSVKEVKGARSAKNSEVPQKKDQKKQSRNHEIHAVDSIKGSTEGNDIAKRKRGRPKKGSTEGNNIAKRRWGRPKQLSQKQIGEKSTGPNMKDSCRGDEARSIGQIDCVMPTAVDEISKNGNSQPSRPNMACNVYMRRNSRVCGLSKTATTPLHEGETISSERVNRRTNYVSDGHGQLSITVVSESQYQDCHEIDHDKYDMMIDDANVDQPLSMCLNIVPPIASDDSRALPVGRQDGSGTPPLNQEKESSPLEKTDGPGDLPVKNLNRSAVSNDKGGGLGTPAVLSIDSVETEESLPFVKRHLTLWKCFNSEETYKKMTPKPHFSPLYKHQEETREDLAISQIMNFLKLVDCTSALQFSSDISEIESGLKSVAELKSHGFDVEKAEESLTQLLLKKQQAGELQKALLELQSKQDTIAQNVKSLQVEFESIVGSIW